MLFSKNLGQRNFADKVRLRPSEKARQRTKSLKITPKSDLTSFCETVRTRRFIVRAEPRAERHERKRDEICFSGILSENHE